MDATTLILTNRQRREIKPMLEQINAMLSDGKKGALIGQVESGGSMITIHLLDHRRAIRVFFALSPNAFVKQVGGEFSEEEASLMRAEMLEQLNALDSGVYGKLTGLRVRVSRQYLNSVEADLSEYPYIGVVASQTGRIARVHWPFGCTHSLSWDVKYLELVGNEKEA